jgi:hypothetical protein
VCWTLYDPDGAVIEDACGEHEATLPKTGRYTILVSGSAIDYALSLQGVSQAFTCGIPITYGDVKTRKIDTVADTDTFNFDGRTNQVVSISVPSNPNPLGPRVCWTLYDPDGAFIEDFCGRSSATLPKTGRYTILISGSAIEYPLSLQLVGGR